jgi:hypothetical protein
MEGYRDDVGCGQSECVRDCKLLSMMMMIMIICVVVVPVGTGMDAFVTKIIEVALYTFLRQVAGSIKQAYNEAGGCKQKSERFLHARGSTGCRRRGLSSPAKRKSRLSGWITSTSTRTSCSTPSTTCF